MAMTIFYTVAIIVSLICAVLSIAMLRGKEYDTTAEKRVFQFGAVSPALFCVAALIVLGF